MAIKDDIFKCLAHFKHSGDYSRCISKLTEIFKVKETIDIIDFFYEDEKKSYEETIDDPIRDKAAHIFEYLSDVRETLVDLCPYNPTKPREVPHDSK